MSTTAIIGAGVVGVACARTLQMQGHHVTLIDPAPPGSTCSFGNAGHIAIDHIRPLARPDVLAGVPRMLANPLGPLALRWRGIPALSPWLARFAAAARPHQVRTGTSALATLLATALPDWQALLAAAGLPEMLQQRGALSIMETQAGLVAARAEGRALSTHGVVFQDLDGNQARALVPALAQAPAGGRLYPTAAHAINPFRLVQALAARVIADGATLIPQQVTGFIQDGRTITALQTPRERIPVTTVLLTAGVASPTLARQLGIHLPLTAERGYHAMLPRDALDVSLPITFAERGFVVTPMEHGIRLAGTVELGAGSRPPDWARADILAEHTQRLFGQIPPMTDRWQGDRPTLPDYLPAIGRVPALDNVVIAAGHQHLGLTLAAVTARLVAGLLNGAAQDLAPFNPGRFSPGRFGRAA
jgi:D-amino-acid dehydrogenase